MNSLKTVLVGTLVTFATFSSQVSGAVAMTEQEAEYKIQALEAELDVVGDIYQAMRIAGDLAQFAIYYPQRACRSALRADRLVVSHGGISPTFGIIHQACRLYE